MHMSVLLSIGLDSVFEMCYVDTELRPTGGRKLPGGCATFVEHPHSRPGVEIGRAHV